MHTSRTRIAYVVAKIFVVLACFVGAVTTTNNGVVDTCRLNLRPVDLAVPFGHVDQLTDAALGRARAVSLKAVHGFFQGGVLRQLAVGETPAVRGVGAFAGGNRNLFLRCGGRYVARGIIARTCGGLGVFRGAALRLVGLSRSGNRRAKRHHQDEGQDRAKYAMSRFARLCLSFGFGKWVHRIHFHRFAERSRVLT